MKILRAKAEHIIYAKQISLCIDESAKVRGTGIARRTPKYLATKIENGNAVIALDEDKFAGFCYIEVWGHGKYVAHSGLIVSPEFRGRGLAKKIKREVFNWNFCLSYYGFCGSKAINCISDRGNDSLLHKCHVFMVKFSSN